MRWGRGGGRVYRRKKHIKSVICICVVKALRALNFLNVCQLDLRSNIIADRVQDLAAVLLACPRISVLNLEHNSLGDDGMLNLSAALPHCSALTTLQRLCETALPRCPFFFSRKVPPQCLLHSTHAGS